MPELSQSNETSELDKLPLPLDYDPNKVNGVERILDKNGNLMYVQHLLHRCTPPKCAIISDSNSFKSSWRNYIGSHQDVALSNGSSSMISMQDSGITIVDCRDCTRSLEINELRRGLNQVTGAKAIFASRILSELKNGCNRFLYGLAINLITNNQTWCIGRNPDEFTNKHITLLNCLEVHGEHPCHFQPDQRAFLATSFEPIREEKSFLFDISTAISLAKLYPHLEY